MAKKKSRIREVVETVESWVGMGPKAKQKTAQKAAAQKPAKKGKKAATKTKKAKKSKSR